MARQTLEQWIREALTDTNILGLDNNPVACSAMSLAHMTGIAQTEIKTIRFTRPVSELELARVFQSAAAGYCQDLTGVQTFCLLAFYGSSAEPQARRPFTVNPESDGTGLMTEAPTDSGRLQQKMRQQDDLHRVYMESHASLARMHQGMLAEMGMQNIRLARENREAFELAKDLILEAQDRRHQNALEIETFRRSSAERQAMMKALPFLANSVTGKEIFPQAMADTQLLELAAEKISPEQAMEIAKVLPPEIMGPLMARLSTIAEQKAREKAGASKALAESGTSAEEELS